VRNIDKINKMGCGNMSKVLHLNDVESFFKGVMAKMNII